MKDFERQMKSAILRHAMPYDPERDSKWHSGLCGEYALALHSMYPHLSIGWQGTQDEEDDGHVPQYIDHIFLHDEAHSYDAFGKRSLDEQHMNLEPDEFVEYDKSPEELRDEWPIDDNIVEEAKRHIQQHSAPADLP